MSEPLDPPADTDGRYKYNHVCAGCDGAYEDCQPLWKEQRVCCPDCDHHKAHPPKSTWRERRIEDCAHPRLTDTLNTSNVDGSWWKDCKRYACQDCLGSWDEIPKLEEERDVQLEAGHA